MSMLRKPAPIVYPARCLTDDAFRRHQLALASNPRDSWPAWTDERWTITEPIDFAGLASRLWMSETTALYITRTTIEAVELGLEDDPDRVFARLEPQNRESFATFLKLIGSPVATWPEWLALCVAGSPIDYRPAFDYRPSRDEAYDPTAEDEAAYLGMLAEQDAREDIMAEWADDARLEAMEGSFAARFDLMNGNEIIECRGFHPSAHFAD